MLELRNLTVKLGAIHAVREVTLRIEGGFVAVVGPNGAGKTTLLKAVCGLIPYEGSVKVGGREVREIPPYEREGVASYIPPYVAAMPDLTVGDLLLFGGGRKDFMERYVGVFGLQHLLGRRLWEVSSGELSRALIVRGLSRDALIYGVDEPLSHIDIRYQVLVLDVLRSMSREGKLVMMATNQLNPVLNYVDLVIALKNGRIMYAGRVDDFLNPEIIGELYGVHVKVIKRDGVIDVIPSGTEERNS